MFLPSNITLKFGDSGDFVAELQRRLAMVKCFSEDQVNGFYDGATVNGVMQFQGQNGLHADGVAGPETLRRLNGVIAGDTSSSSDTKQEEEEKQRAQHEAQLRDLALAQQEPQPAAWGEPAPREEAPAAPAQPTLQAGGLDPAMFAPAAIMAAPQPSPAEMADRANRELLSPNPAQELNNLIDAAAAQERVQQQQAAPPLQPPPQPPQPQQRPPEALAAAQAPQAPLAPPAPPPQAEPAPVQQQAEPQSLVQRAGRFANAMVQKLADYFEAKLPPSVLNEVKAAGQIMAASGVKEAPIPTGPEMGGPAQAPARGPEQQQGQIR